MTATLVLWFVLSVVCDVSGQLCFKIGMDGLPDRSGVALAVAVMRQPWIVAGIAIYTVELFVWLRILADMPLSIAFPIASLNFIGVTLAGRFFLKESVAPRQWLGVGLITLGVVIVARSA